MDAFFVIQIVFDSIMRKDILKIVIARRGFVMSFFNDAQKEALLTGIYKCPVCGNRMDFEDEYEETLVCPQCGYDEDVDHYGFTDEEYKAIYPTREEVCDD